MLFCPFPSKWGSMQPRDSMHVDVSPKRRKFFSKREKALALQSLRWRACAASTFTDLPVTKLADARLSPFRAPHPPTFESICELESDVFRLAGLSLLQRRWQLAHASTNLLAPVPDVARVRMERCQPMALTKIRHASNKPFLSSSFPHCEVNKKNSMAAAHFHSSPLFCYQNERIPLVGVQLDGDFVGGMTLTNQTPPSTAFVSICRTPAHHRQSTSYRFSHTTPAPFRCSDLKDQDLRRNRPIPRTDS